MDQTPAMHVHEPGHRNGSVILALIGNFCVVGCHALFFASSMASGVGVDIELCIGAYFHRDEALVAALILLCLVNRTRIPSTYSTRGQQ